MSAVTIHISFSCIYISIFGKLVGNAVAGPLTLPYPKEISIILDIHNYTTIIKH